MEQRGRISWFSFLEVNCLVMSAVFVALLLTLPLWLFLSPFWMDNTILILVEFSVWIDYSLSTSLRPRASRCVLLVDADAVHFIFDNYQDPASSGDISTPIFPSFEKYLQDHLSFQFFSKGFFVLLMLFLLVRRVVFEMHRGFFVVDYRHLPNYCDGAM